MVGKLEVWQHMFFGVSTNKPEHTGWECVAAGLNRMEQKAKFWHILKIDFVKINNSHIYLIIPVVFFIKLLQSSPQAWTQRHHKLKCP